MPREARLYELPATLDGGTDGLPSCTGGSRRERSRLTPGGSLVIESSEGRSRPRSSSCGTPDWIPSVVEDEDRDAHVVVGRR